MRPIRLRFLALVAAAILIIIRAWSSQQFAAVVRDAAALGSSSSSSRSTTGGVRLRSSINSHHHRNATVALPPPPFSAVAGATAHHRDSATPLPAAALVSPKDASWPPLSRHTTRGNVSPLRPRTKYADLGLQSGRGLRLPAPCLPLAEPPLWTCDARFTLSLDNCSIDEPTLQGLRLRRTALRSLLLSLPDDYFYSSPPADAAAPGGIWTTGALKLALADPRFPALPPHSIRALLDAAPWLATYHDHNATFAYAEQVLATADPFLAELAGRATAHSRTLLSSSRTLPSPDLEAYAALLGGFSLVASSADSPNSCVLSPQQADFLAKRPQDAILYLNPSLMAAAITQDGDFPRLLTRSYAAGPMFLAHALSDSLAFAKSVLQVSLVLSCPHAQAIMPETWVLPQDIYGLRELMNSESFRDAYWVVKKRSGLRGQGETRVLSTRYMKRLLSKDDFQNSYIVQRPALAQPLANRRPTFRMFLLVLMNPLRVYSLPAGDVRTVPMEPQQMRFGCSFVASASYQDNCHDSDGNNSLRHDQEVSAATTDCPDDTQSVWTTDHAFRRMRLADGKPANVADRVLIAAMRKATEAVLVWEASQALSAIPVWDGTFLSDYAHVSQTHAPSEECRRVFSVGNHWDPRPPEDQEMAERLSVPFAVVAFDFGVAENDEPFIYSFDTQPHLLPTEPFLSPVHGLLQSGILETLGIVPDGDLLSSKMRAALDEFCPRDVCAPALRLALYRWETEYQAATRYQFVRTFPQTNSITRDMERGCNLGCYAAPGNSPQAYMTFAEVVERAIHDRRYEMTLLCRWELFANMHRGGGSRNAGRMLLPSELRMPTGSGGGNLRKCHWTHV
jgi:hypothetical protein